ncbi:MAG: hypothetical protein JO261_15765 [Alphaproteobacteria bacterium]|nr:hypothetical protein [Alphaproteobacteria bacterium]MBV9695150.1 hypothetical protein [Alphaproteobacteria bacterium]
MRIFWRILGGVFAVAVLLAATGGAAFYVFSHKFIPAAPDANYPKPRDPLEAQRQDLDYFVKLIDLDRAYAPGTRAEAHRRLEALAKSNTVLDRAHLRVTLASIAALADNGHTSLYSRKPSRAVVLPLRLAAFSDGIYVMRAMKDNADLLGARVTAIDGRPIDEVLAKLARVRGGTQAWRLNYARLVLNSSEFLHGLDVAPATDRSTWTFRTRSGATVTRDLVGSQPAYEAPFPDLWRWESPDPVKGDRTPWLSFRPEGWTAPIALQDPDSNFRRVRLKNSCVMLIQLRANEGDGIGQFLADTEADLAANKPCAIIFDNRANGGGDYTNTAGFAGRLASHVAPGGHIYLLTSVDTFSAGITTTVFIKQAAAPGQVVILGEPVGDRLTFWAEGGGGCLPNAPFCFHYATGLHDYAHPCRDWDKCYWVNWVFPAHTDTLAPRETLTKSFADWQAGRDPVFDRALALAQKDRPTGS